MRFPLVPSLLVLGAVARPTEFCSRGISIDDTANELVEGNCGDLVYIFARGTSETGNMGTIVGPPVAYALKKQFGDDNVVVQGVDYPADVAGAIQGSLDPSGGEGAMKMADLAQLAANQCPDSAILLAGYSQGAQQVHGALMNLGSDNNVKAAVTFGDPLSAQEFDNIDADRTKVFCAPGDAVCDDTFIITPAHLSYGVTSAKPAAAFVKSVVDDD